MKFNKKMVECKEISIIIILMTRLTKKDAERILQECIKFVKSHPKNFFSLRKSKKFYGCCYWTRIEINPKSDILSTGIHECVHYLYQNWSETQVRYAEKRIINSANMFDLAEFLYHLSSCLYETEKNKENVEDLGKRVLKRLEINNL